MNAKDLARIATAGPGLFFVSLQSRPALMIARIDWKPDLSTLEEFLKSQIPAFQIDAIGVHSIVMISSSDISNCTPFEEKLSALKGYTHGHDTDTAAASPSHTTQTAPQSNERNPSLTNPPAGRTAAPGAPPRPRRQGSV